MCRACTFNHREKDYPWLRAEVERYIKENPQVNSTMDCDIDPPKRNAWHSPQPYSATWYMIENYILLREGKIAERARDAT